MSTITMNKKDELIMRLVHYFITEENYNPIIVNGVKDEIWLENDKGPYKIVRINSNNIFNKEQLNFDTYKINSIVKQIKKKTLSFSVNTLNIQLNVNEDLSLDDEKNIYQAAIQENSEDITAKNIIEAFPNINEKLIKDSNGLELILNVTKEINEKTEETNKSYEKTFSPKKIVITPMLILICIAMFVFTIMSQGSGLLSDLTTETAVKFGANVMSKLQSGELWRLFTYMFLHGSIMHIVLNMYSLYVIGSQMETFIGKTKYIIVYILSGITGGLLSSVLSGNVSVGASGAIFGLLGAMLYFGYHYRTYLGGVIKSQIIPIIALNILIGFMQPNVDNFCHIGGLVGGLLAMMALGVEDKSSPVERINGGVCLAILIGFLTYLIMFV